MANEPKNRARGPGGGNEARGACDVSRETHFTARRVPHRPPYRIIPNDPLTVSGGPEGRSPVRGPSVHARPSFAPVGPLAVRVAARSVCLCRVFRFRVLPLYMFVRPPP